MVITILLKNTSVTIGIQTHTLLNRNTRARVPSSHLLSHDTQLIRISHLMNRHKQMYEVNRQTWRTTVLLMAPSVVYGWYAHTSQRSNLYKLLISRTMNVMWNYAKSNVIMDMGVIQDPWSWRKMFKLSQKLPRITLRMVPPLFH